MDSLDQPWLVKQVEFNQQLVLLMMQFHEYTSVLITNTLNNESLVTLQQERKGAGQPYSPPGGGHATLETDNVSY